MYQCVVERGVYVRDTPAFNAFLRDDCFLLLSRRVVAYDSTPFIIVLSDHSKACQMTLTPHCPQPGNTTFIFEHNCNEILERRSCLSYEIRQVEATDAAGIYAVERACFHDPYPSAFLNDLIEAQEDHFFVATIDGEIIGYAVASVSGEQGHVVSVAVDPRHRRRQIGTALLSAVTERLVKEGVKQIHLEVRKGNAGAISFYKQMGYQISSEIAHYYADGEDAWVLRRAVE